MLKLNDRKWKEFKIIDILGKSINAKAYHSNNLIVTKEKGLPYVTRTSLNNGLYDIVQQGKYVKNPKNSISFGAENAQYFYQPYEYITGNKMYYYYREKIDYYSALFVVSCLNKSIKDCGFGYGMGLTGTRSDGRTFMLPVNNFGEPDFVFMQTYIKEREEKKRKEYLEYASRKLEEIKKKAPKTHGGGVITRYKPFVIKEVFTDCERGKRLTKEKQTNGNTPYISSTALNNGIDSFIGNAKNVRVFKNSLSLANSGSVGSCFYEPFEFIASDHITHLKNEKYNKFHYLFLATMLNKLKEKYNFNREISDKRIEREKIMLPEKSGEIYLEYCESLIVLMMKKKYHEYIDFAKKRL